MASTYTPSHDTEPSSSSHSSVPLATSAHPPRLASLAGTGLTSASAAGARDNWGGLLSSDASSPSSPAIGVAVGAGAGTGGGEEAEAAIGKLKDAEEALKERCVLLPVYRDGWRGRDRREGNLRCVRLGQPPIIAEMDGESRELAMERTNGH